MSKHKSPFTVDYRKPIIIASDDPRNKNGASLNKYKSRAGSKIIITDMAKPRTLQKFNE